MSEKCIQSDCNRPRSPDAVHSGCFHHEVTAAREMDRECLWMVRETLEGIMGEGSMHGSPPMMYPEAIMSACAKVARVAAETGNARPSLPVDPDR